MAAGCAAGLAWLAVGVPVGVAAASPAAAAVRAADTCPDAQEASQALDTKNTWSTAGTKGRDPKTGAAVTIGVVGAPDRVAEAVCAAQLLAPDAAVAPGATGLIVIVADTSVDPATIGGGSLVVAAAGDTGGQMLNRPPGIVNVTAADLSGAVRPTSSYGPLVTLAAYGNDTSTAAGYVAGLAALLRVQHPDWPAWQVVAQMAGSIHPGSSHQRSDQAGYGRIKPVQAVDPGLPKIPPSTLPGFYALFPASVPGAVPSPVVSSTPSASASASQSPSQSATQSPSLSTSSASVSTPVAQTTDTAQQWPTADPVTANGGGPSNGANPAAGKSGGGGGVNPVLVIGLLLLLGGGGYVAWQRRRPAPAATVNPEAEWEAPSGPRHSGYSPPEE